MNLHNFPSLFGDESAIRVNLHSANFIMEKKYFFCSFFFVLGKMCVKQLNTNGIAKQHKCTENSGAAIIHTFSIDFFSLPTLGERCAAPKTLFNIVVSFPGVNESHKENTETQIVNKIDIDWFLVLPTANVWEILGKFLINTRSFSHPFCKPLSKSLNRELC